MRGRDRALGPVRRSEATRTDRGGTRSGRQLTALGGGTMVAPRRRLPREGARRSSSSESRGGKLAKTCSRAGSRAPPEARPRTSTLNRSATTSGGRLAGSASRQQLSPPRPARTAAWPAWAARPERAGSTRRRTPWVDAIDAEGGHRDGAALAEISRPLPTKALADYPWGPGDRAPGASTSRRSTRPHQRTWTACATSPRHRHRRRPSVDSSRSSTRDIVRTHESRTVSAPPRRPAGALPRPGTSRRTPHGWRW